MIDYSKNFLEFCKFSKYINENYFRSIDSYIETKNIKPYCEIIIKNIYQQKGVFTVLVTLLFYKILHKEQDIRLHKKSLNRKDKKGFSGRSFDTKYITPILKQLGLPSMAESGWLTRSLEQALPYDLDYPGKISGVGVKESFLHILDSVEEQSSCPNKILRFLINKAFLESEKNLIKIERINFPEEINISDLVGLLKEQFNKNYNVSGGAKLPMIAFHAIYKILLLELVKFNKCTMPEISSYTASDRTSRTAGDLEVFLPDGNMLEAIEIKLNIPVDLNMVLRAKEKIYRFNPKRYYILSTSEIKEEDYDKIIKEISEIRHKHGCQLIVNGILYTLKYYFRLIKDVKDFVNIYSELIENDKELKYEHKRFWAEQVNLLNISKGS